MLKFITVSTAANMRLGVRSGMQLNSSYDNAGVHALAHGARGETFLSQFILYPLRATSPTRGTLGDITPHYEL
jgi:hypothetical protein